MNGCEHYEALVSAWLDDQLERSDQVDTLDHLVRCAACRRFYGEARALDGLVAEQRTPRDATAPAPDTWRHIERRARATSRSRRRSRVPVWALSAAASIILAVGLGALVLSGSLGPMDRPADAEIVLGEGPDSMTETRFVALTREVLQADQRYHTAMLQVMEQVVRETGSGEVSSEGLTQHYESNEMGPPDTIRRDPA